MYHKLEDGIERHEETLSSIEKNLRTHRFLLWVLSLFVASLALAFVCIAYVGSLPSDQQHVAKVYAMYGSIPIVALLFTWFHIWLAIQMMFRPIKFFGIWEYKNTGVGIGWQGVVPRKAEKMARVAFSQARSYLNGPQVWFARVDPHDMVIRVRPYIKGILRASLFGAGRKYFPEVWDRMGSDVQEELVLTALERLEATTPIFWKEIVDVLVTKDVGIDNDTMVIAVFMDNKELLNEFFFLMGARELRFIEQCGAALGFICGLVQLIFYAFLSPMGRMILLPSTGFFLGIVTNWLALLVCFWPTFPHPVRLFGKEIFNAQGLFMQRQKEVSEVYSKLLVDHFFCFEKVMAFMDRKPVLWNAVKRIYDKHNAKVVEEVLGPLLRRVMPAVLGQKDFDTIRDDLNATIAKRFAEATDMQEMLNRYLGAHMDVERDNAECMQAMPADKFENLLHPIFKEDEWILVLLGGVLGLLVGAGQVYFLGK